MVSHSNAIIAVFSFYFPGLPDKRANAFMLFTPWRAYARVNLLRLHWRRSDDSDTSRRDEGISIDLAEERCGAD